MFWGFFLLAAVVEMMTNLRCARDLQEMRIKKKYKQNVSSQPGSLYVIKTSVRNRISLKTAVEEKIPCFYSAEEVCLYLSTVCLSQDLFLKTNKQKLSSF